MAVIVRIVIDPASQEDHDRFFSAVAARFEQQGGPSEGLMVHLATPTATGFEIVEAWRTEAAFRSFHESVFVPAATEAAVPAGEPTIAPAWSISRP